MLCESAEALLGMDVLIKKCSSSFVVTRASSMRKQKLEESRQQAMTEIDVKPSNLDVENNSANMSENEVQADLQDDHVYVQDHDVPSNASATKSATTTCV
jgi:hypothetical protein